jgi:hypothetical protein
MSAMPPGHARGYSGEQDMGFFLGERGYFFVEGPSGSRGHGVTSRGFDGVAFNPKTRYLIIYDNKSVKSAGPVYGATAIDPGRNLVRNLNGVITCLQQMPDVPNKSEILDLLRRTRTAAQNQGAWPSNVDIAVSNAGGRATGVSSRLSGASIKFIDYYRAPQPKWRSVAGNQDVAAALGSALGGLAEKLGEFLIEREVRRRLENELARSVRHILARGDGVLVVVALQEWEIPDFQGRRARGLLDVYVEGAPNEQTARRKWEDAPHLLKGAPKGWRVITQYGWVPPAR